MLTDWSKPCSAVFLLMLLLTGCAMRSYREDSSPPASSLLMLYQTQVAIGECVFKPKPEAAVLAAIATALATSAISQGVNYLGKAIEEAAKETNDRVIATRNIEVTAKTFGPCIQILRGWFYRGFNSTLAIQESTPCRPGKGGQRPSGN